MDDKEEVLMVLRAPLAELMALTAPQVYSKFVTIDANGRQILYVKVQKALYGLLKSALLFYRKLWGDLHAKGFTINPYNPYGTKKDTRGLQMTVCWHVDDLKMSHESPKLSPASPYGSTASRATSVSPAKKTHTNISAWSSTTPPPAKSPSA